MADLFDLPGSLGAYALLIQLPRSLTLPIPRLQSPTLAPGLYVYCGSARGPGGLAARVGRHLRAEKPIRWHVDHLTTGGENAGRVLDVLCLPDGDECELVGQLGAMSGVAVPVPGFGSSDCRQCRSHLLSVPTGFILPTHSF
ncbi:MAG: GIY-YIG nuclease family protein [Rhodospirillaceae bacterium]|jgi:Uri superfamily endonuclease|nr:GIY-YIG nuclease family protein [Rhodospirillaceae bacterium]MBT4042580.1 GIY-YIG nuclease family protein [Rhodospirillaceae bacterium]MBT4687172.1 GIY-YIG nuclease family protein [Rhodospirillaceae bacterium]MBT5083570.1 GIY-YIG nuclease family protein [Rhodospirillaceae bacterium]MBT5525706.1 GIY-YIG nuclease family protein [Rhodospirillaceae bacterium]